MTRLFVRLEKNCLMYSGIGIATFPLAFDLNCHVVFALLSCTHRALIVQLSCSHRFIVVLFLFLPFTDGFHYHFSSLTFLTDFFPISFTEICMNSFTPVFYFLLILVFSSICSLEIQFSVIF